MLFRLVLGYFVNSLWISGICLNEKGVFSSRSSAACMTLSSSAREAMRRDVMISGRLAESAPLILPSFSRTRATAKKNMKITSPFFCAIRSHSSITSSAVSSFEEKYVMNHGIAYISHVT